MKVVKITPRGFCHGVVNALQIVSKAIGDSTLPQPIYILGEIVHNSNITKAFSAYGVISLTGNSRKEILAQIDQGTVIITAHGIDYHLIIEAKKKGLYVIDATCSDVYKTHNLIKAKINNGYDVLYIGKKNHPEPEGVMGIDKNHIHLITCCNDIDNLKLTNDKLCITNQTTMSMWDVYELMQYSKTKYPNIEIIKELCDATTKRQEAVLQACPFIDLCLIIGDQKSNNSQKLVEVCQKQGNTNAYLVEDIQALDYQLLLDPKIKTIGISAGASTPSAIVSQICEYIEQFDPLDPNTYQKPALVSLSKMVPRIKRN